MAAAKESQKEAARNPTGNHPTDAKRLESPARYQLHTMVVQSVILCTVSRCQLRDGSALNNLIIYFADRSTLSTVCDDSTVISEYFICSVCIISSIKRWHNQWLLISIQATYQLHTVIVIILSVTSITYILDKTFLGSYSSLGSSGSVLRAQEKRNAWSSSRCRKLSKMGICKAWILAPT